MRGVILAGGKGTRLLPATRIINKHLIPIGSMPMVEFPLHILKRLGITNILLVTGGEHIGDFAEYLGDGAAFGVSLTYRVQKEAAGIAHALFQAEDFFDNERVVAILGDNIFDAKHFFKKSIITRGDRAKIFLSRPDDPTRFGVPEFDGRKKIVSILEKPKQPPSPWAVTGLYCYPRDVFSVIKKLKPSPRGELEITDVNNYYVKKGRMDYAVVKGFWSDAGTPESLFRAHEWLRKKNRFV